MSSPLARQGKGSGKSECKEQPLERVALELIVGDFTDGAGQGKGLKKGMVVGPWLVLLEVAWLEGGAGSGDEPGCQRWGRIVCTDKPPTPHPPPLPQGKACWSSMGPSGSSTASYSHLASIMMC